MSDNFETFIKIYKINFKMKNSFSWKLASKYVEFAFEDGGLRPFGRE